MRGSTIVRIAMIAVLVAVVVAVSMLWRDRPDEVTVDPEPPEVEPDVVSRTRELEHVSEVNGIMRYKVSAGRGVSYEGNRQEYRDNVRLELYSEPETEDGAQDLTVVTAERMELRERDVPVDGDRYERVRLLDGVLAVLPNGAEFAGDEITYGDDELSTNEGVRLRAGGIVVESRLLSYDPNANIAELAQGHPDSARPDLRGPVKLWSEGDDGGAPTLDLDGRARRLIYDVRLSLLRLFGAPQVSVGEAGVRGREVFIGLDEAATSIESVEARGNANALWTPPDTSGEYIANAEIIAIELSDEQPTGIVARTESVAAPRPTFAVDGGEVRAEALELDFGDTETATLRATGEAYFFPASADTGLAYIAADALSLGPGGFERLAADGNVEIELAGRDSGEVIFTGPRATFEYRDDAVAAAEWPAGLRYRDDGAGTTIAAGYGRLDAESGDWLLREGARDPAPGAVSLRPSMRSAEIDVGADEIDLHAGGDIDLRGAVQATLTGDVVRTVGALFGDAPEVEAAADAMYLGVNGDRVDFVGNARIWQAGGGDRLLRADEIELRPAGNELEAQGNVFVNLVDAADPEAGRDEPRTILLSGQRMLVEERSPRLVVAVAGDALLELLGQDRIIGGGRLSVELTEEGTWQSLEVFDNVVMTDPAGRGQGGRLEYNADTGVVTIYAPDGGQAAFVNDQDIDIRDREGLRLEWQDEILVVTAMQNGTTQTVRGGQR